MEFAMVRFLKNRGLEMGCKVLPERKGQPACGIKGVKTAHAITRLAVDVTDHCDVDIGKRVVLTYACSANKQSMVKVGVESENGEDFRCWDMRNLRSAHNPKAGKKRGYARLKGFLDIAHAIGMAPAVLAYHIFEKAP